MKQLLGFWAQEGRPPADYGTEFISVSKLLGFWSKEGLLNMALCSDLQ
jgi:hypothetical protein